VAQNRLSPHVASFFREFSCWTSERSDIRAALVVGSHAQGIATETSDVDLVVMTRTPSEYISTTGWIETFGAALRHVIEPYGALTLVRVWYDNGLEVEFGFTPENWSETPEARAILAEGMYVLVDRRRAPEAFDDKVDRVLAEAIEIAPYDPAWPTWFAEKKAYLRALLPNELIRRIEHAGSTAVPGLAAKPIVDMLVEVTDLDKTKEQIVPFLERAGYDYFWRSNADDDSPPHYAWFIGRDFRTRRRTHHIHMVEANFPNWEALLFRDYLIAHPETAEQYERLKRELAVTFRHDREGYTAGKGEFIRRVTAAAKTS